MEARCEENSRTGTTTSLSPAAAACGAQPRYPPPPPSPKNGPYPYLLAPTPSLNSGADEIAAMLGDHDAPWRLLTSPHACRSRSSCRNNRATVFQMSVFCRTVFAKRWREGVQRPRNTRCPNSSSSPPAPTPCARQQQVLCRGAAHQQSPWAPAREVPLHVASCPATGCQTGGRKEIRWPFFLETFLAPSGGSDGWHPDESWGIQSGESADGLI